MCSSCEDQATEGIAPTAGSVTNCLPCPRHRYPHPSDLSSLSHVTTCMSDINNSSSSKMNHSISNTTNPIPSYQDPVQPFNGTSYNSNNNNSSINKNELSNNTLNNQTVCNSDNKYGLFKDEEKDDLNNNCINSLVNTKNINTTITTITTSHGYYFTTSIPHNTSTTTTKTSPTTHPSTTTTADRPPTPCWDWPHSVNYDYTSHQKSSSSSDFCNFYDIGDRHVKMNTTPQDDCLYSYSFSYDYLAGQLMTVMDTEVMDFSELCDSVEYVKDNSTITPYTDDVTDNWTTTPNADDDSKSHPHPYIHINTTIPTTTTYANPRKDDIGQFPMSPATSTTTTYTNTNIPMTSFGHVNNFGVYSFLSNNNNINKDATNTNSNKINNTHYHNHKQNSRPIYGRHEPKPETEPTASFSTPSAPNSNSTLTSPRRRINPSSYTHSSPSPTHPISTNSKFNRFGSSLSLSPRFNSPDVTSSSSSSCTSGDDDVFSTDYCNYSSSLMAKDNTRTFPNLGPNENDSSSSQIFQLPTDYSNPTTNCHRNDRKDFSQFWNDGGPNYNNGNGFNSLFQLPVDCSRNGSEPATSREKVDSTPSSSTSSTSSIGSTSSQTSTSKKESEKFSVVLSKIRRSLSQLPPLGNKEYCKFCKNNKEHIRVYSTHVVKDACGTVLCPILKKYVCPLCGASGSNAHTVKYCPNNQFDLVDVMDRMLRDG